MSEELQKMAAEILPETDSSDTEFEQPARGDSLGCCETRDRESISPSPTQPQGAQEPDGAEMKALAKAFAVNLAWTMAGLFDKK